MTVKLASTILASLSAFGCLSSASADYLDGSKRWASIWKELKTESYVVKVNHAGDMSVTVGGVTFGFGQLSGRWRGKNFSTHNDLNGVGPWSEVVGSETKQGDAMVLRVEGTITDLAVTAMLVAGPSTIIFRWRGEIVDPSPELERILGHASAFCTWRDKTIDPTFTARLSNGESVESHFRSEFGQLSNVRSFSFESGGSAVRIDFAGARSVVFTRDDRRATIPVRLSFAATGANPECLMPGARMEYEIRVTIRPTEAEQP